MTTRRNPISAKVFVGNLNFQTTSTQLEQHLAEAGQIVDIYLPNDRATGRPRGFAFVEFSTPEEAAKAIELFNEKELDGRALRINEAGERPPRSSGPPPMGGYQDDGFRSFGGGGGGGGGGKGRPSKPKGSRRGMRGKKRSL